MAWEKMMAVTVKGSGELESGLGFFLLEDEPDPLASKFLLGDLCVSPAPHPQLT